MRQRKYMFILSALYLSGILHGLAWAAPESKLTEHVVITSQIATEPIPKNWQERSDFGKYFQQAGVKGTFLLYDLKEDRYFVYDAKRANTSFLPASTFKVFNSLVALETGAIADENVVIKWDGIKRELPEWNQDQTLRSAIKYSTVWFYQELARRIGSTRMQRYINLANYGNRDIGGGIDRFWLDGKIRISPKEQIDFLVKLYQNKLPFSKRSLAIVKDIMIREKTDEYVLRGKTGWASSVKPNIGWFVGYLELGDRPFFFAINIDIQKPDDAKARINITKQILSAMNLLPKTKN
ncbi:class D beta-lactamase [Tumidithrix elongata RA019]|uniref:beta-lactamase n=1 Tax=Tumidithrix elongata BACA0141 TaxID=2716417 RepID=A0AAW9PWZ2_9CYAN|nr:class D beta-lactamase [Tumidithrix elongata RA019]